MVVASIVSPSTGPYKLPLSVASPDTDFSRFLQLQAQAVSSMPIQSVAPGFSLESRDNLINMKVHFTVRVRKKYLNIFLYLYRIDV
jgi:hypothetical protein